MKRILSATLSLLVCLGAGLGALAQNADTRAFTVTREFKNRVFEVKYRDPSSMVNAVALLGSGFQGASLSVNNEFKTITVRDFPENLATIEEAIRRLDQPTAGQPEIEFHVYALIGTSAPVPSRELPSELVDVAKELQATLRYGNYVLLTTSVHHTRPGNGVESSGVAETKLLGKSPADSRPIYYNYTLRGIDVRQTGARTAADVESFRFAMKMPLTFGENTSNQDVGFETPVTIREGEKVVVGTTTVGDMALIVVVTAKINPGK